ncbi:MAG: MBL fold metallo-hydrolase [Bdellovibrionales bacterium]|nr:MBL fold metallo-hydrolase [Bdellovibrionales bacterium]
MVIEVIRCLTDNLCYLVGDGKTDARVLVDASEAGPIVKALGTHTLSAVLLTHHHHDHIGGLTKLPTAPLYCSERDSERVPTAGGGPIRIFDDGTTVSWRDLTGFDQPIDVTALHIPGHTEGQIAFLIEDHSTGEQHVFVGDTLFTLGCGRCLEGTPQQLFQSVAKLKRLPGETRIHFGHEYSDRNFAFLKKHEAQLDADGISNTWKSFECPQSGQIRKAPRLDEELQLNPFLQFTDVATFTRWRRLRDLG